MPLGTKLPFPGVFPDPLDPQGVQDLASGIAGKQVGAPIPEQAVVHEPSPEEKAAYESPLKAPEINQDEENQDMTEMSGVGAAQGGVIFPGMSAVGGNPAALMDEGSNYLPVGGPYGRDMVNEAFNKQPKRLAGAVASGAEAQVDEARAKEAVYASERDRTRDYEAALKEQYLLRQQEMQKRQAELEKKTQDYSNNLADQGAFWHNPQNIVAAFGAALMQLSTDDRSFGYKLLNGAIQADLHNRRALADQHLGYLKSNMAEYDRIAGDRIAGMQLAELEAKRVAALELERIAAQFQGPKAKANAEAIQAKLWQDVRTGYMDFYNRHIYNKPQLVDKRILESYRRGGSAEPGVGYTTFADASNPAGGQPGTYYDPAAPGGVGGLPSKAMGAGAKGAPGASAPAVSAPMGGSSGGAAAGRGGFPQLTPAQKRVIESRYEGGSAMVENAQRDTTRIAFRAAGVPEGTDPRLMSPAQKHAFNKSMEDQEKAAYEQLKSVSGGLQQTSEIRAGLRVLQTDMAVVESAVQEFQKRGLKISMDDVLGTKTKASLGSSRAADWKNLYAAFANANPEERSKWEAQRDKIDAAGQRLNQLLAGQINSYYKEHAGAAVTATELPRLKEYVGGDLTYDKLKTFMDNESRKQSGSLRNALLQLPPAAQAMWLTRGGVNARKLAGPNVPKYQPPEAPAQEQTSGRQPKGR